MEKFIASSEYIKDAEFILKNTKDLMVTQSYIDMLYGILLHKSISVRAPKFCQLSPDSANGGEGKIECVRGEYDMLDSIEIACVSPSDIKSVSLYMKIGSKKEGGESGENKENEDWMYHEDQIKYTYKLIKSIENPKTSVIKLFGVPFPIFLLPYNRLFIDVKYTDDHDMPRFVKMNMIALDTETRKYMMDKYTTQII